MAVTVGTISAAEEAALTAGKILFVGTNALRRRNAVPVWSSSGSWADSGTAGVGANLDDASYPTRYLYDDVLYNYTQPAAGAVGLSTVYLLLDLVDGTDDDQTTDVVWLKPINWHLLDGSITATLEVADNSAFTTNLRTVTTWSAWDSTAKAIDVRIGLDYVLGAPYTPVRLTNVRYARLKLAVTSPLASGKLPQIGELVMGRRRQLGHLPRLPWDPGSEESAIDWFESETNGVVGGDVRYRGRSRWVLRFRPTSSGALGVDETQALRDIYDDTDGFTRPFLYVDDPTAGTTTVYSGQGDGHFVYTPNPVSVMPYLEQYQSVREAEIELVELPPYQSSEV